MNATPPMGKPALPFKAYAGNEPYIFVSYAPEDSAQAYPEMLRLHQAGYRVCYDEGTATGDARTADVETAILHCAMFLVFVTASLPLSRNARHEIQFAVDAEKLFLAVYLEPTDLKAGLRLLLSGQETIRQHELSEAVYHDALRNSLPEAVQAQSPFDAYLGDEPFIFVSYSHKDSARIFPEILRLHEQGYRIWYDQGIPIGSNWRGSIGEALAKCAVFLVFITPRAAASEEVYAEIHTGFERWKKNKQSDAYNFVVVYLEPTDLPADPWYFLKPVQGLLPYQTTPGAYRHALERALDRVRGMRSLPLASELAAQGAVAADAVAVANKSNQSANTNVDDAKEAGHADTKMPSLVSAPNSVAPPLLSSSSVRLWGKPRRKSINGAAVRNVSAGSTGNPTFAGMPVQNAAAAPQTNPQTHPATKINPKDRAEMILIPAGEFQMGDDDQSNNPRHTVYVESYYLYKTPVTVAQYRLFCEGTGRAMPQAPSWGWKEDHPVVNITWEDATEYCTWAGARLPTEAEWEKAASWDDAKKQKRQFPWGEEFDRSMCANSVGGNNLKGTLPVGSFPTGASLYGALDMAGNVWEWCADWYAADYTKSVPEKNPTKPAQEDRRVARGGSWVNDYSGFFRASYRSGYVPSIGGDILGFRCASGR